jgi:hypothetical protein
MYGNEKRVETNWSFNCNACSKQGYDAIEDAVYYCGIVEFLAKEMDWGEGAIQNTLMDMCDFDPDRLVSISIEVPETLWDLHETRIEAMFGKIEDALDDNAGGWNCNC